MGKRAGDSGPYADDPHVGNGAEFCQETVEFFVWKKEGIPTGEEDMDPDLAIRTRRQMIERAEAEEAIVGICHHTGFGRIVRSEGKRYWQGI